MNKEGPLCHINSLWMVEFPIIALHSKDLKFDEVYCMSKKACPVSLSDSLYDLRLT